MAVADSILLGRDETTTGDIAAIAAGAQVRIDALALAGMAAAHQQINRALAADKVIYGLTTGVGDLVTQRLSSPQIAAVQLNMLKSHACGTGADLAPAEVRAMMAIMIKSLLQGYSGVSPSLVDTMAMMLNRSVIPWAPAKGSVGYLIATAHIGLAVFGHGKAWYRG